MLEPGNTFCGPVPSAFPALAAAGVFVTGPAQESLHELGERECTTEDEIDIDGDWYGDHAGDSLSSTAIAGQAIQDSPSELMGCHTHDTSQIADERPQVVRKDVQTLVLRYVLPDAC